MNKRFSTDRIVLAGAVALFVLAAVLLAVFRPKQPDPEPPVEQNVAVTTFRVVSKDMDDIVKFPGRVEAWSDVQVSVEQGGRVMAVPADEGQTMAAGAELLRLDDRLRLAAFKRAERQTLDAKRDLERLTELRDSGAVSASDFDAMETRAALAGIALDEARVQWQQCVLAAPIQGVIEERRVSAGEYVQPGQPVFRIVDVSRVKVCFDVPERDVLSVRLGDTHRFRLDSVPDREFAGTVRFVAMTGSPANNAFRVEMEADNAEGLIRPGMIARVDYVRGRLTDAVILPQQAVVPTKGETVVFVVEDGRAIRRIVRIGAFLGSEALIREGVSVGDDVILEGNRSVLDGTPVRVVQPDADDGNSEQ